MFVEVLHYPTLEFPEVNWTFACIKSHSKVKRNYVHHKVIYRYKCMVECANIECEITRSYKWWLSVVQMRWQFHFHVRAKVFIWRVAVGGLPLEITLQRWCVASGIGFVSKKHSSLRFTSCLSRFTLQRPPSIKWGSISGMSKSSYQWVFFCFF